MRYEVTAIIFFLLCIASSFSYYIVGMAIYNKPFRFKRFIAAAVVISSLSLLRSIVIGYESPVGIALQFLFYPFMAFFSFDQRGIRVFFGSVAHMAIVVLVDMLYGVIALRTWPSEVLGAAQHFNDTNFILVNLYGVFIFFLVALALLWITRTFRRRQVSLDKPWVYVVRPIALALATIMLLFVTLSRLNDLTPGERMIEQAGLLLTMAIQLLLCLVYVFQDAQLLKIARSNESLVRQQKIYDTLLKDTRAFRHNIANLLYGFEGAILTGDIAQIEDYYSDMSRSCARINNENIVALGRIQNAAVSAMLLNKLEKAARDKLPMYILAREGLLWRGIPQTALCQTLGILIDNAMEAASEANAPYVAVEFGNVRDSMEIVVRNTFNESKTDMGFLNGRPASSKPDHEGVGLSSAKSALSRFSNVAFNQIRRGRYIESLVLID